MVRKQILLAIREIKNTLRSINLLTSFLDSLLVFLLSIITLLLISLPWYWALLPFVAYFAYHYKAAQKKVNLAFVEEKTPSLQEELRTSADNLDKDNEIVNALHEEVLMKMRNVHVSDFIDFRKVSKRLLVITLLSFLVLLFAAFNVSFLDVNDLIDDLQNQNDQSRSPYADENYPEEENRAGAGSSIFGEESIAELGQEELALQFNPVATELNLNQVGEPEELEFNRNPFTGELASSVDRSFETDPGYVQENKDVVQRYFQGIATT